MKMNNAINLNDIIKSDFYRNSDIEIKNNQMIFYILNPRVKINEVFKFFKYLV